MFEKGKIDKQGDLHIWRKSKFKHQYCKDSNYGFFKDPESCDGYYNQRTCGDWCPKFNEPRKKARQLKICDVEYLLFREPIIDERE